MKLTIDITDKAAAVLEHLVRLWKSSSEPANNDEVLRVLSVLEYKITRRLKEIMANQQQFDADIARVREGQARIVTAIEGIGTAVSNEGQQIRDFIAANPSVDTSALTAVADQMDTIATNVEQISTAVDSIFTAPSTEPVDTGTGTPVEGQPAATEPGTGEAPADTQVPGDQANDSPANPATEDPAFSEPVADPATEDPNLP